MYVLLLCSTCMFKTLLLLQVFMLDICWIWFDELNAVSHTLFLNMYLTLLCFICNTNHWHENSANSTRHMISLHSAVLWPIRSATERLPQWLVFELGPPFDIRCGQVALVLLFIQFISFSRVSTLPPTRRIRVVLLKLIAVKSWCLTVHFNEIFLFIIVMKRLRKNQYGRECFFQRNCRFNTAYNVLR
jgi:hypothetical protein